MTTGNSSQLFGSIPIGSVIQAPFNPDPVGGSYLLLDGTKQVRNSYPLLAATIPVNLGTFTVISRTLPAAACANAIDCDGVQWALSGAQGTSAIYTTPDGIHYTARTTPAGFQPAAIKWLGGNNWVAADQATAPIYSSNGAVTWNASTGGLTTNTFMPDTLAYAPPSSGLGSGSGRLVQVTGNGTNSASIMTSDDLGHTYTARTHGLGTSIFHVCWTGSQYFATTGIAGTYTTSPDGITWTLKYFFGANAVALTNAANQNYMQVCSNGNGTVIISAYTNMGQAGISCIASFDNANTWSVLPLPVSAITPLLYHTTISYTNGKFVAGTYTGSGVCVSADAKVWVSSNDPSTELSSGWNTGVTYSYNAAAGYYFAISYASSKAITVAEDLSKFYLPGQQTSSAVSNYPYYIRAK